MTTNQAIASLSKKGLLSHYMDMSSQLFPFELVSYLQVQQSFSEYLSLRVALKLIELRRIRDDH